MYHNNCHMHDFNIFFLTPFLQVMEILLTKAKTFRNSLVSNCNSVLKYG